MNDETRWLKQDKRHWNQDKEERFHNLELEYWNGKNKEKRKKSEVKRIWELEFVKKTYRRT